MSIRGRKAGFPAPGLAAGAHSARRMHVATIVRLLECNGHAGGRSGGPDSGRPTLANREPRALLIVDYDLSAARSIGIEGFRPGFHHPDMRDLGVLVLMHEDAGRAPVLERAER